MTGTERRFPHYGNGEPTYWRKWAIVLMSMPIGIVVQCLLCSVLCSAILGSVSVYLDSKEQNKRTVEQVLRFAQENPTGPFPQKDYAWYAENGWGSFLARDAECWTFLQDAVAQNSNQYSLIAYDNGIVQFRDVDDSIVQVDFADGRKVRMVFYQGYLNGCRTN